MIASQSSWDPANVTWINSTPTWHVLSCKGWFEVGSDPWSEYEKLVKKYGMKLPTG
jgi:hypothetical protein